MWVVVNKKREYSKAGANRSDEATSKGTNFFLLHQAIMK